MQCDVIVTGKKKKGKILDYGSGVGVENEDDHGDLWLIASVVHHYVITDSVAPVWNAESSTGRLTTCTDVEEPDFSGMCTLTLIL